MTQRATTYRSDDSDPDACRRCQVAQRPAAGVSAEEGAVVTRPAPAPPSRPRRACRRRSRSRWAAGARPRLARWPVAMVALVVAHGLELGRVGASQRFHRLLGAERVVAGQRLARGQPSHLAEHARAALIGPLVGVDRGQLELRELRELRDDLLLAQVVVAGDGELLPAGRPRVPRAARIGGAPEGRAVS